MKVLKELQKATILSAALAVFAFGPTPAFAAAEVDQPAGTCVGASGTTDCTAAVGHIGVSVVGTLSINELHAIEFGDMTVTTAGTGDATVAMDQAGALTLTDAGTDKITLLHGANANGGAGPATTASNAGGQSPGIYAIKGAGEDAVNSQRVYISFTDATGNPMDVAGDTFYPTNFVDVSSRAGVAGNKFQVNQFKFNESGHDVYGHYINDAVATEVDVKVGATLHTVASAAYPAGRYDGTFNIIASY